MTGGPGPCDRKCQERTTVPGGSAEGATTRLLGIDVEADDWELPNAILGLFDTPAGNVTVASGFAAGTADLVIGVTGWWR